MFKEKESSTDTFLVYFFFLFKLKSEVFTSNIFCELNFICIWTYVFLL